MAGKDKPTKSHAHSARPGGRAADRVDRGLEADATRPLYSTGSIHSTDEQKFAFDSDGPAGGPVVSPRTSIEESDEELRQRHGRTEPTEEER